MTATAQVPSATLIQHDHEVLHAFALRWAILAAWRHALALRGALVGPEVDLELHAGRVKLSSGTFSVCEVGCDLSIAEAGLSVAETSSADCNLDFWLELLAQGQADQPTLDFILQAPTVREHFDDCGFKGCRCDR